MLSNDIRQSQNWSKYLKLYNWDSHLLTNGSVLRTIPFLNFSFAKLQRPNNLNESDISEVEKVCKEKKVLFLKLFPNINQDIKLLKKHGFIQIKSIDIPSKTMIINLSDSLDNLWGNLTSGCRYSINKSSKQGDTIKIIQNPSTKDIQEFHFQLTEWAKGNGVYVQGINDLLHKVSSFKDQAYICNVYDKKGALLGGKMFLGTGKTIFGVHAVTSLLGKKSCGGYKLLWECFEYFKEKGYTVMDFDGVMDERMKALTKKWYGHTFFKKQFNGKVIEYPLPMIKFFLPF